MKNVLERIGNFGIIPVITISNPEDSQHIGKALLDGGLPCAEITLRSAGAIDAIKNLSSTFPEILIGAGTVLSSDQAEKSVFAGAQFIVSPGFDPHVAEWCQANGVPYTPGVATPSEINMALDFGLQILKFFPSEAMGGVMTLKAISAPYSDIRFIPTGGINSENLPSYLLLPSVHACGGSWIVSQEYLSEQNFPMITTKALEAVEIVREVYQTKVTS